MSGEDLVSSVLDEIALEGLEGITLDDLWQRLGRRPSFNLLLDDTSKKIIWEIAKMIFDVKMFELPEPRKPLVIFDRYKCVDPELGMVLEPEKIPEDIYPHYPIDDPANGIMGSCHTYGTRVRICHKVKDLSFEEVSNRYGRKLVLVASQTARNIALKGPDADPMLELTILIYCVLERIGRSRYHGEVTQGKISLQVVGEDPKSLFYLRKFLTSHNLAVKQVHHQKSGTQNCSGSLLHLPRFYVERKPKALYLTEKVIEMLKLRENYIAEYEEVRQELGLSNALKKLFKTFDFQKYVKTDMRLPYRQLYPNAPISEWKLKGNDKEKMIRVIQLIDPNINVQDLWVKEEEEEENDGDAERTLNCCHLLDRPLLSQAYFKIEEAGSRGYSQMELSSAMGISKLQSRTLCRNLLKCNLVATYMKDIGRQRVSRFMAKKFEKECVLNMQFNKEREKMLSLAKDSKNASEKLKVPKKRKTKETFGIMMKRQKLAHDSPLKKVQQSGREKKKTLCQKEPETFKMEAEQSSGVSESEIADAPKEISSTLSKTEQQPLIPKVENYEEQQQQTVKEGDSLHAKQQNETKVEFCEKLPQASEIDSDSSLGASVSISSFSLDSVVEGTEPSTSKSSVSTKRPTQKTHEDGIVTEIIDFSKSRIKNQKSSRLTEELKNFFDHQGIENPSVTYRLLKRANIIIETIKKQEVIDDFTKLMKIISHEEDKEGYKVKIDKKSLMRLLFKLSNDGILKVIKVTLQGGGKEKVLNFACEPSVTIDHSVIQSAIEQAKVKFFILNEIIKTTSEHQPDSDGQKAKSDDLATVCQSLDELQAISSKNVKHSFVYDKRIGKKYGFSPKFVRMKSLHQFLFYLIYGYQGDPNLDQAATIKSFEKKDIKLTEDEIGELSRIYVPEISWKMFVPKLPFHLGWPNGWALMCDILLRLPLSVFVQLVNVSYIIPELDELLKHPIRKHMLVKYLPPLLRGCLMASRRYIFSVHEVMQRLCFIGLLRFSPQRLKEKDQVFIYLNKRTSLLDTTTSKPGYHQISSDVVYGERRYVFRELIDVDKYWYEMWNICLHTNLGGRLCMDGKDIVLEMLHSKPAMVKSLEPVGANEAAELDTGDIPGDKKGAAGLDSAIFAHLKRNWNWPCTKNIGNCPQDSFNVSVTKIKPQPKKHEAVFDNYKGNWKKNSTFQPKSSKKIAGQQGTNNNSSGSTVLAQPTVRSSKSKANITRRIKLRPSKRSLNKPYYDEADRKALRLMSKLRVEWSQKEDNLLLLCKVASMFLFPNPHQQIIGFHTIRDLLHKKRPESFNKTSRACQRRILYMMKNVKTSVSVAMMLEEIRQDSHITKQFNISLPQLRKDVSSTELENVIANKFIELVDVLEIRSEEIMKKPREFIPDSIEEFWEKYHVVQPTKSLKSRGRFQDVTNVTDILSSVVNGIIHSSLCVLTDKTSWSYQLFKVYQQFPDNLLRSTMAKIREDHMVSLKKPYMHLANKRGNYLPLSSSPYQHSISYLHILQTKYQYSVYNQAYKMGKIMDELYAINPENGMKLLISDGGSTATLIELFCKNMVEFKIEIPEQIIILNPKVSELDESYVRIVERYREILQSYRSSKDLATTSMLFKSIDDDQDGNSDFESDDDKNDPDFNPDTSANQQNALARTASRIALYMMREEMEDKSVSNSQHAHDFFVVNSCAVYCHFVDKLPKNENEKSLLPLQQSIVDNCLKRISSSIVIHNEEINDEHLHEEFIMTFKSEMEWPIMKKLLSDLAQRRELGMRQNQLKAYCKKYFRNLTYSEVIQFLRGTKIIIRVGVTSVRYVHNTFIQPWLVWTYRLERLMREKIVPVPAKALGPDNDIIIERESNKNNKRKRVGSVSYQAKKAKLEVNSVMTGDRESFTTPQSFRGKLKKFSSSSSNTALLKAKICTTLAKKRLEVIRKKISASQTVSETAKEVDVNKVRISQDGEVSTEPEKGQVKDSREEKDDSGNISQTLPPSVLLEGNVHEEIKEMCCTTSASVQSGKLAISGGQELEPIESDKGGRETANIKSNTEKDDSSNCKVNVGRHRTEGESKEKSPHTKLNVSTTELENGNKITDQLCSEEKTEDLEIEITESIADEEVDNCKSVSESGYSKLISKTSCDVVDTKSSAQSEQIISDKEVGGLQSVNDSSQQQTNVVSLVQDFNKLNDSSECTNDDKSICEENEGGSDEDSAKNAEKKSSRYLRTKRRPAVSRHQQLVEEKIAKAKELSTAAKLLERSEAIHVCIRPWVRIDGTVNRRVLDRMLGAILGHSMFKPGNTIKDIAQRFSPALQPFHVRELIEILNEIGCVKLYVIYTFHNINLFTEKVTTTLEPADGTEDDGDIVVEPQPDSILRLGQFIGDKAYTKDFMSS